MEKKQEAKPHPNGGAKKTLKPTNGARKPVDRTQNPFEKNQTKPPQQKPAPTGIKRQPPQQKTPPPTQKKEAPKPAPIPEPASEEEELLLIEEDGDFFWVIQGIIWGIIKTVSILGGIALLFWFIWGGGDNDPDVEVPIQSPPINQPEPPTDKEEPSDSLWDRLFGKKEDSPNTQNPPQKPVQKPTPPPTNQNPNINPRKTVFIHSNHAGIIAAQKNAILEEKTFGSQDPLKNGMMLLRKMDDIFQVPLAHQLDAPTAQAREAKINAFLMHIHDLIKKSVNMRSMLSSQYLQAEGKAEQYANEARLSATQISNALTYIQPQGITELLEQNIAIENQVYTQNALADIQKAIVSKLQTYENSLRSVNENINANREALILDIQVVNYQNDPFGRVLTPAQWRATTQ